MLNVSAGSLNAGASSYEGIAVAGPTRAQSVACHAECERGFTERWRVQLRGDSRSWARQGSGPSVDA